MTRMFRSITRTWNPFVGCLFKCSYCWSRRLAETRLRHLPRYKDGFKPKFISEEFNKRFKPGEFVFVSSMGDIAWAAPDAMAAILRKIMSYPRTNFLLQTKKPQIYLDWQIGFPPNVYLGTTIESNFDWLKGKAPRPYARYLAMTEIQHPHKFVSIEPIMNFDLQVLVHWIDRIKPEIIEVGYDNYGLHLPEPPWEKVETLLHELRQICPKVVEKDGLSRLKGE